MSKQNYQNYNKHYNNQKPSTEAKVEEVVEEIVETPVEDTVEEQIEETKEIIKKEVIIGVVTGCNKLNVRKSPSPKADKVATVEADSKLMIDMDESTAEYYKVYTESGIDGYCVKEYVTVS